MVKNKSDFVEQSSEFEEERIETQQQLLRKMLYLKLGSEFQEAVNGKRLQVVYV